MAMALISCNECGKEISTLAKACPGCGAPNMVEKEKPPVDVKLLNKVIGFFFLIIVIYLFFKITGGDSKPASAPSVDSAPVSQTATPSADAPVAPPAAEVHPAIKVTALQLLAEYNANEVAADIKYKRKPLQVSGRVASINKDFTDSIYIAIQGDSGLSNIHASGFSVEQASIFKKNQSIVINCIGGGLVMLSPILKECSLASSEATEPPTFAGIHPYEAFSNKDFLRLLGRLNVGQTSADIAKNFEVASEVTVDGEFLVGMGCQAHSCGSSEGMFFYDIAKKKLSIFIFSADAVGDGKISGWGTPATPQTVLDESQVPSSGRKWFAEHGAKLE
jgi:hypothetical protein